MSTHSAAASRRGDVVVPASSAGDDVVQLALTSREPDPQVHPDDLAWWLAVQERWEIRSELAERGLL